MKRSLLFTFSLLLFTSLFTGCMTAYRWTSRVPENMRTVFVPTFQNKSEVTELGNVVTRQVARELQREGTFKIRRADDAAIEIQGTVSYAGSKYGGGDRRSGSRLGAYLFVVKAKVSVIDRVNGRVLIDNREYTAEASYVINQDRLTGERNASGSAADLLAQRIVDDLTNMQW